MDEPWEVLAAVGLIIAGALVGSGVLLILLTCVRATWGWFASGQWRKDLWP